MLSFKDKVGVITGAGSGIGRELARQLAAEGARLALIDWNSLTLQETLNEIAGNGGQVWGEVLDVSQRDAVFAFAQRVIEREGQVDLVINNAGITIPSQPLEATSPEAFEKLFSVNLWGVIHGSQAFLPHLKARPEAALVNLSSVFGLFGYPGQGPYVMTKFAVRGFTETLRNENRGGALSISCVHPGGINTNIVRNTHYPDPGEKERWVREFERKAITSPAEAAATIIRGIRRKQARILIGRDARLIDRVVRLLPGRYEQILMSRFLVE